MADAKMVKRACEIGAINLNMKPDPGNETETKLGIYSNPQMCCDEVKCIVVHGGAGTTIHKRLYHAANAILCNCAPMDGRNKIYIMTGERKTTPSEIMRIKEAGFTPAEDEFGLALSAIQDLFPGAETKELPSDTIVYNGVEYSIRCHATTKVLYFGVEMQIVIFETSFNPERKLENGDFANRANFDEAMLPLTAAKAMFIDQKIYFVAHDIWQPWSALRLQKAMPNTTIVGNGPYNLDRWSGGPNADALVIKDEDQLKKIIGKYDALIG